MVFAATLVVVRVVASPTDRIVVVGAGLSGLSAALYLAGAGRRVTVVERAAGPGGRAGPLRLGGYRFDTGPTVLTMPELIGRALAAVGERLEDWLDLRPLAPVYRAHFPDLSTVDVYADVGRMAGEVERQFGRREADGYLRFVEFVTRLYHLQLPAFIDRNFDSPLDLLTPDLLRLAGLGGFGRLATTVRRYFREPRLRRVFSFQSMYAGLSPYDAPALYAVIAYLDTVAGVYFPAGGIYAVPAAMASAAARHGVRFRYRTAVSRVDIRGARARGVVTADGELIPADAVVLTADLPIAYRDLLPAERTPRRLRRLRYSPSCVLMHVGSPAQYRRIAHHNIHFGRSWRGVFREVVRDGELMSDPSVLVTNASRTDPTAAPTGRHTYQVLAPTPHLGAGIDWSVVGPRYRDELVATLEARGYVGFGDAIEVELLVTPAEWAAAGLAMGTPFAASHALRQTGPFRPPNIAPGLDNVVFAGSGTQPGVGVPMVLLSGRLAAERVTGPGRGPA